MGHPVTLNSGVVVETSSFESRTSLSPHKVGSETKPEETFEKQHKP